MREKYQKEMSRVHAPKELVEKTKLAMLKEEQLQTKSSNKRQWMRYVPIAAAAVAAVLVVVLIPGFGKQRELSESLDSTQSELMESELMLEQLDLTPNKITQGSSELNNIETFIIDHYPEEFLSDIAEEKEVEGIPVRIVKDGTTGFYKAVFAWESDKILVISEMIEMDRIVDAVKEVIQTLAAQTKE